MCAPTSNPPACQTLGYQTDLAVLALQGARFRQVQHGELGPLLVIRTPENPQFWWGNFLLLHSLKPLERPEALLQAFATELPEAQHRVFGLDIPTKPAEAVAQAWQARGFKLSRSTVLTATRTRPVRPLPAGVELRPLTTDADWQHMLELREAVNAADDSPIPNYRAFAKAKLRLLRRAQERGQGAYFGAFVGGVPRAGLGVYGAGTVAGGNTANNWAGERLARFQTVETHPGWRSRGLAGNLVHAAGEWARANLGARRLVIVADPNYHAQALYQRLGFVPTQESWGLERPPPTQAQT